MSTDAPTPFLTIEIPRVAPRSFYSVDEAEEFFQHEFDSWNWIRGSNRFARERNERRQPIVNALTQSREGNADAPNRLQDAFRNWFALCPYSDSRQFRFLQRSLETYGVENLDEIVAVINRQQTNRDVAWIGALRLAYYELSQNDDDNRTIQALPVEAESYRQMVSTATEELSQLKAEYKSIQDLKEPTSYWKQKKQQHGRFEKVWGGATAILAFAMIILLPVIAWCTHSAVRDEVKVVLQAVLRVTTFSTFVRVFSPF